MTYSLGRPFAALPALNVKEYADHYEVSLAAPGIDPQKVKIELKENILTISYENKKEQSHQEGDLLDKSIVNTLTLLVVCPYLKMSIAKASKPSILEAFYTFTLPNYQRLSLRPLV